jgi:hypothetical protein
MVAWAEAWAAWEAWEEACSEPANRFRRSQPRLQRPRWAVANALQQSDHSHGRRIRSKQHQERAEHGKGVTNGSRHDAWRQLRLILRYHASVRPCAR